MKKRLLLTGMGICAMVLVNCKATKRGSGADYAAGFTPQEKQVSVAESRWPGTTASELSEGQHIFVTKCVKCHQPVEITSLSEKKWLHEIEEMAPKARLSAEEKDKLTRHILSYRQAHTPAKKM